MHGVRHVSRRPVAVFVLLTTSFKKRSVWLFLSSRSASWLCPLPHVRHPFGAMRSCLVQLQENKGTRSPCFVAPAFRGAREKLRRATGPKVTLHLALFFLLWHEGLRHGLGTSLLFHRCQSNLLSTGALLSNRTSVKVSFPRSPPDSTTTWVFRNVQRESLQCNVWE